MPPKLLFTIGDLDVVQASSQGLFSMHGLDENDVRRLTLPEMLHADFPDSKRPCVASIAGLSVFVEIAFPPAASSDTPQGIPYNAFSLSRMTPALGFLEF